jgi:hypothetical protein
VRSVFVVVAVAALLSLGANSGLATVGVAPAMHVVKLHPFTVQGLHFKPAEHVTVTLVAGKRLTASRTANAAGTFTATFPAAVVAKCTAYTLHAVGVHGSKAAFKPVLAAACNAKPTAALAFSSVVDAMGQHFKPGESLTVTLVSGSDTWTRHVKATAAGSFTASFGALSINDCSEYTLKVVGSLHSSFSFSHALVPC